MTKRVAEEGDTVREDWVAEDKDGRPGHGWVGVGRGCTADKDGRGGGCMPNDDGRQATTGGEQCAP